MDRREFLAVVGGCLSIGLAGCLGGAGTRNDGAGESRAEATGTDEPTDGDGTTDSTAAGTPDYVGDIWLGLENYTNATATVRVSVAKGGEPIVEAERRVEPGESEYVDPGIDEIGEYEVVFSVDGGPEQSSPVTIEDYTIRTGSNLFIWIREDDVQLAIEE